MSDENQTQQEIYADEESKMVSKLHKFTVEEFRALSEEEQEAVRVEDGIIKEEHFLNQMARMNRYPQLNTTEIHDPAGNLIQKETMISVLCMYSQQNQY